MPDTSKIGMYIIVAVSVMILCAFLFSIVSPLNTSLSDITSSMSSAVHTTTDIDKSNVSGQWLDVNSTPGTFTVTQQMSGNLRSICKDASGNIHVIWKKNNPLKAIAYAWSADNGDTWTVNNSFYPAALAAVTKDLPSISCDGNTVTAAYGQGTDNTTIGISTDNGLSWSWKYPISNAALVATSYGTPVERRGNRIYHVSSGNNDDLSGVFFTNSTDGGTTWSELTQVMEPTVIGVMSNYPSMAVDGNGSATDIIYLVASDYANDYDVYFVNSTDAGSTWSPIKKIMTNGGEKYAPSITYYGANLYVVAKDVPNHDIYFVNSTDRGSTWSTDYRLDTLGATDEWAVSPVVSINYAGEPVVYWEQNTTGTYNIVYREHSVTGWGAVTYLTNDAHSNKNINAQYNDSYMAVWMSGAASPYHLLFENQRYVYDVVTYSPDTPIASLFSNNGLIVLLVVVAIIIGILTVLGVWGKNERR